MCFIDLCGVAVFLFLFFFFASYILFRNSWIALFVGLIIANGLMIGLNIIPPEYSAPIINFFNSVTEYLKEMF